MQEQRDLESLAQRVVDQLLRELARFFDGNMPTVLTRQAAAKELSIGMTKLKALISSGSINTCTVGGRQMIPRSEVLRLAHPQKALKRGRRGPVEAVNPQEEAQRLRELRRKRNRKP